MIKLIPVPILRLPNMEEPCPDNHFHYKSTHQKDDPWNVTNGDYSIPLNRDENDYIRSKEEPVRNTFNKMENFPTRAYPIERRSRQFISEYLQNFDPDYFTGSSGHQLMPRTIPRNPSIMEQYATPERSRSHNRCDDT